MLPPSIETHVETDPLTLHEELHVYTEPTWIQHPRIVRCIAASLIFLMLGLLLGTAFVLCYF